MRPERPLRIAFVSSEYVLEPSPGGLASYLKKACAALLAAGHEPVVFVAAEADERLRHDGVEVFKVARASPRARWTVERAGRLGRLLRWPMQSRALCRRLAEVHRRQPFDVAQFASFMAVGLFRPRGLPAVGRISSLHYVYDSAVGDVGEPARARSWLEGLALAGMDAVFGPSAQMNARAEAWLGTRVHTIETLHAPAPGDRAGSALAPAEPYLLFFGTVSRLKGADRLISIAREIIARTDRLHLVIAGRAFAGELPDVVAAIQAAAGPAGERVRHLGALGRSDLDPLIAHAELVLLPSRADNLPNACIEAMGAGRVVVAPSGAGFEQLITPGVNGFLFAQEDADAFPAAVRRALNLTAVERGEMGRRARARISAMAPETVIGAQLELYRAVIARSSVARASGRLRRQARLLFRPVP